MILPALGILSLMACSGVPLSARYEEVQIHEPSTVELESVLSGESLLRERASALVLPEEDIFALSEPMRAFLETHVPPTAGNSIKLRKLVGAIVHPRGLGLRYNPFKTYTAADTFRFREGNCLAFTVMVIAMARELGIEAHFNEVEVPPIWDMQDENTYVLYKHINAMVNLGKTDKKVVDLNLEDYDVSYPQREISDRLAKAQYYNNRGIEYLYQNHVEEAFRYIRKAIELEPEAGFLWGSLGTVYRRAGFLRKAEIAYLQALRLTPGEVVSVSNLERLYRQRGEAPKANIFYELASDLRRKNPYYRYNLAQKALEQGDLEDALEHVQAAIRGYRREHRFHHLAAVIYYRKGDNYHARKSLVRAAAVAQEEEDSERYRNKLERLMAASN